MITQKQSKGKEKKGKIQINRLASLLLPLGLIGDATTKLIQLSQFVEGVTTKQNIISERRETKSNS